VIASHDFPIGNFVGINVPQKERPAIFPLHAELLVEVAIVNLTTPADADSVSAHQPIDSAWIERANQQIRIFLQVAIVPEETREPANRQIRDRVKFVEDDSEMFF